MRRLDSNALHGAIKRQRHGRGVSQEEVAREIGVALSTIRRMKTDGRREADGMLAIVDWAGRSRSS